MATLRIPWPDGNGNVILTYTGQGDGTVTVTSDTDNPAAERSLTFTVKTTDGSVRVIVTVRQASGMMELTARTVQIVTTDGNMLRVKPPVMDALLASGAQLISADGQNIRVVEVVD